MAALDLMKNEAGCRNSFVGIVLFNWNDINKCKYCNISVKESFPPSLKDELEAKIEDISKGTETKIKELEELIVQNKIKPSRICVSRFTS